MTVIQAQASDRARWNGYVEGHASASVYHRWEWGEVFESVYGVRWRPLLAERAGRVVGVLPLVRLSNPMHGASLVGLPWFGHGGAITDDDETFFDLVAEAARVARGEGARHVELRHAHAVPETGLVVRRDKVLMRLDLEADEEAMFRALGSKLRNDIRKREKEGLRAKVGGRELIPAFHAVYASVLRDLGSPSHAEALFDRAAEHLPDHTFVVTVEHEGRTVAGGFLAGMNAVLEVPCSGALHAESRLRANTLLFWTAMREGIRRGYRALSFGRSSVGTGTYQYKKGWGAKPLPLPYHYVLTPGAEVPTVSLANPRYARVISAWQQLPVGLTTLLGPYIVRHLA